MREMDGIDVLIEHLRQQQQAARAGRADALLRPPADVPADTPTAPVEPGVDEMAELEAALAETPLSPKEEDDETEE